MGMYDELYIVGSSWLAVDGANDLQLDELVFAACSRALHAAGVMRHQIGFSVTSSLDLYDARSISSALTAPAAAGYLTDELRVEGDSGAALSVAAAGLASGATEYAIVVAEHVPEVGTTDEVDIRQLDEHVSSYTFDSHMDRPVGMTASTTLGLHAAISVDEGRVSVDEMAAASAHDITRGASRRGTRAAVDPAAVSDSPSAFAPLTQLMLPAASAGVGVLVLAAGVAAKRCPNPVARISGQASATGPRTSNSEWLRDPCAATAIAREKAYAAAGLHEPASQVEVLEMTDLSPALSGELLQALRLDGLAPERVNPSGGVRANYPGVANCILRIIEATEALANTPTDGVAVVQSMDNLCGLVSSTSTVLVLEAP